DPGDGGAARAPRRGERPFDPVLPPSDASLASASANPAESSGVRIRDYGDTPVFTLLPRRPRHRPCACVPTCARRLRRRRRDSASQSLSKTIVLGLEDYFLGAIAALNLTLCGKPGATTRAMRSSRMARAVLRHTRTP